jgi:tight adherence protein B
MPSLVISFLVFSFFFFMWVLMLLFGRKEEIAKRLDTYLTPEDSSEKMTEKQLSIVSKILKELRKSQKKSHITRKTNMKTEFFLQSAGVDWSPSIYLIYRWMAGIIGGGVILLLTSKLFLSVFIFMVGFWYPKLSLNGKRKKRLKQFNDGLADMITSIINSLRAGFSFSQSLKAVEEEVDSPIKEEIALVLKEMQYGGTLEDALFHLYERMPSKDLDIMIQAILIQRQVGGNLATVLSNIVETIRERNKIYRQVKTLTAQGKMSGMVIGAMPFVIGFIVFLIQPSYVGVMFKNPIGIIMLTSGLISGIIGFLFIRKITKIEV